jgi:hypothetical protein
MHRRRLYKSNKIAQKLILLGLYDSIYMIRNYTQLILYIYIQNNIYITCKHLKTSAFALET